MNARLSRAGGISAIAVIGLLVLTIPAALPLVQGVSSSPAGQAAVITGTPLPLPPLTPTATPTPAPGEQSNDSEEDGQRIVVDDTDESAGAVGPNGGATCQNPDHRRIQAGVDAATPGARILVCPGSYDAVTVGKGNLTIRSTGGAVIESSDGPAVRITAPGVTVRDFTLRTGDSVEHAVDVGGRDALVRNNTIDAAGIGMYLRDGQTSTGKSGTAAGSAAGSRIVDNSVEMGDTSGYGIWADADRTLIHANTLTVTGSPTQDAGPSRVTAGTSTGNTRGNTTIVSSGNDSVIRDNTIRFSEPRNKDVCHCIRSAAGIQVGLSQREDNRREQRVRGHTTTWHKTTPS